MGPPGYRYGVDLGSMGCGGDTGLWDPLVTDMGGDLGSMGSHYGGVEVTQGLWDRLVQIWGGFWGHALTVWGVELIRVFGTPWIQIWGGIWGLWDMNVTQGCGTP